MKSTVSEPDTRGGDSAYERGGDARRKFLIKPLKETDLGGDKAFFDRWKRPCEKTDKMYIFKFFRVQP